MADNLTSEERSALMGRVRGRDTTPELVVRRLLHAAGYRYRLHKKELPGKPDIVFGSRKKAIFVHGCFWHQHSCKKAKRPATNPMFWNEKLDRNVERDRENIRELNKMGWQTLVIWECQTKDAERLLSILSNFMERR